MQLITFATTEYVPIAGIETIEAVEAAKRDMLTFTVPPIHRGFDRTYSRTFVKSFPKQKVVRN